MLSRSVILFCFVLFTNGEKECVKNEECDMEGSICDQNECICPPDTIANSLHTKCLAVAESYGSPCTENVQCSQGLNSGGICVNNTCECSLGYHYFLGRCWKSSGLGEKCKHHENCFVNYDFEAAVCSEKSVCVCSPGYYQREYSSCRRESFSPGNPCGISLDCKFENAVCGQDRTCHIGNASVVNNLKLEYDVPEDYNMPTNVELRLQLQASAGDPCKNNDNCPKNAECTKGNKCSCKQGYYPNSKGSCSPELGAKCSQDSDCIGKNTQCRNGTVCVCKQGFVTSYNGRYCDKLSRDIGWSCLRDEQCSFFGPRSSCANKKCQCNADSHFVTSQLYCWVQKLVGDTCVQNEDCGDGDTITCTGGTCNCGKNTHPSSDKQSCRNDSTTVREPCTESIDCTFDHAVCDEKNKLCSCMKGYFNVNGSCNSGVGGKCVQDNDCNATGSSCVKGLCVCKDGFINSQDYSKCLPIITSLNETCAETSQCSKIYGVCENGSCECVKGSHFVDNWHCFISKGLNQNCTSNGNCTVPNSHCLNGFCRCLPRYHYTHHGSMCSGVSTTAGHVLLVALLLFVTMSFFYSDSSKKIQ